jgi:hypothetical protein
MSLWGNLDASNNAPVFWDAGGYSANVSANASVAANASNAQIAGIFGNTTIGFWREGVVDGIFGVDTTEANSQFSTGDGRYVTHAGWVHRVVGTGPVTTITANAGATGVNSFITFSGGSSGAAAGMTGNTSANAIVYVNSALYIVNVTIVTGGSYANTPIALPNTGNAVFTVTMGGRANRVQQETIVAMGSMTGDATTSDDANYPDS